MSAIVVKQFGGVSPGTLVLTGNKNPNVDYLSIIGVRAYSLQDTWYAGPNSINKGSLGWIFDSDPLAILQNLYIGSNNQVQVYFGSTPVSAIYYGSLQIFG